MAPLTDRGRPHFQSRVKLSVRNCATYISGPNYREAFCLATDVDHGHFNHREAQHIEQHSGEEDHRSPPVQEATVRRTSADSPSAVAHSTTSTLQRAALGTSRVERPLPAHRPSRRVAATSPRSDRRRLGGVSEVQGQSASGVTVELAGLNDDLVFSFSYVYCCLYVH